MRNFNPNFIPTPIVNYLSLVTPDELSHAAEYRIECEEYSIGNRYISLRAGVVRADGAVFCTNPYAHEIHGVINNQWITPDDHYEMCQDI